MVLFDKPEGDLAGVLFEFFHIIINSVFLPCCEIQFHIPKRNHAYFEKNRGTVQAKL